MNFYYIPFVETDSQVVFFKKINDIAFSKGVEFLTQRKQAAMMFKVI